MDNMLEHPWTELQVLIKEKWLTQKAFASILWKKVSEVNELLKWKRNITIQRDYLLHQTLWTPIKYWILKQIDYDYSLIDIDKSEADNQNLSSVWIESNEAKKQEINHYEQNKEFTDVDTSQKNIKKINSSNHEWTSEQQIKPEEKQVKSEKISIQDPTQKDDEDFKKRAKIFKSF